MIDTKKPQPLTPKDTNFKEDDLSPKGRTKHIVETDWPTKEAVNNNSSGKKRKIKRTENARLP